MPILFLLFVLMPIIEITLLIEVGSAIGGINTIGLVLCTAALGAYFVKREGISTLHSATQKMQHNQLPADELAAGACLLIAGVLLITPGFITDSFGFLLIIPQSRRLLVKSIGKQLTMRFTQHQHTQHYQPSQEGDIFEGEYTDHSDTKSAIEKNTKNEKKL